MPIKITDEMRLQSQLFQDECKVECWTVKIVTTRKAHICFNPYGDCHTILPGDRAYCERAIVDGEWASSYCCIPHLDKYIRDYQL